ncbi:MAG: hypothetical protein ACLQDM_21035 [Bradyrhizobium sp.]
MPDAEDDASNIQVADIFVDGGATGSLAGVPIYRGQPELRKIIILPVGTT